MFYLYSCKNMNYMYNAKILFLNFEYLVRETKMYFDVA